MFKFSKILAASAVCTLLGACATTQQSELADTKKTAVSTNASQQAEAITTLQAYHWDLEGVENLSEQDMQLWQQAQEAGVAAPRLTFAADNILAIQNLCNIVSAPYAIDPKSLNIEIGNAVGTMMACSSTPLMALENWISRNISTLTNWGIQPTEAGQSPQLLLEFSNGTVWSLLGEPTDETRFGSQPVSFFLEIAPQAVACSTPDIPDATCLQVREITYNEQGVQTGAGNWQAFNGVIEGFTFEPGTRSILRLNRYKRENVQAGQAPFAYVLDMRVLSEKVQ